MRSLLLDANVLVLLIMGRVDRHSISSHKRCRQFTEADFDLLLETVSGFQQLVVTTSVLTETSNLLAYTPNEPLRGRLLAALGEFVRIALEERPESAAVVGERAFIRLGLTDAGLITCVQSGHFLLTTDTDLYLEAVAFSENVVNFAHLRQRHLLS